MVRKGVERVMESLYGPSGGEVDVGGAAAGDGPIMRAVTAYAPRALEIYESLSARLASARGRVSGR